MMYLELDRADARGRQELAADLRRVLDDVRARGARLGVAAGARCARTPRRSPIPKARRLLNWFADGAMTLLGYQVERPYEAPSERARHLQHPGRSDRRGRRARRDALFRAGRRSPADGQGRAQVDRPPPRSARPRRRADQREAARSPASASMPACGPARRCAFRPRRCRCCASGSKQLDKDFGFDPKGHSRQGAAPRGRVASARPASSPSTTRRCASW